MSVRPVLFPPLLAFATHRLSLRQRPLTRALGPEELTGSGGKVTSGSVWSFTLLSFRTQREPITYGHDDHERVYQLRGV
jgi:hypothetical protein